MVIRDLTLRSAASFGSFHLIRLLYDEFMFYLVEQRVAKHLDKTAIAVIGLGTDFFEGKYEAKPLETQASSATNPEEKNNVVSYFLNFVQV